ncbi:MAG: hypothetical protein AAF198_06290 [Pseudomonadota bacterium]
MANELVYIDPTGTTGLTITAEVFAATGAAIGTGISCTDGNSIGRYVGDMPAAAAGIYYVRFTSSDLKEGGGIIHWDGSAEVTLNVIDTVVDSVLEDTDDLQSTKGERATATGFSTFDPTSDTVARVTLVDTTTDNTDMRGTDGAVTSAGDATASQQTSILNAISALNNLSSADVTAAVPTTAEIEAALLNEGDGQQLIDAIVLAIGNENVTAATIAAAVWATASRTLTETTDSNLVSVNGVVVDGAGTEADPFGPA